MPLPSHSFSGHPAGCAAHTWHHTRDPFRYSSGISGVVPSRACPLPTSRCPRICTTRRPPRTRMQRVSRLHATTSRLPHLILELRTWRSPPSSGLPAEPPYRTCLFTPPVPHRHYMPRHRWRTARCDLSRRRYMPVRAAHAYHHCLPPWPAHRAPLVYATAFRLGSTTPAPLPHRAAAHATRFCLLPFARTPARMPTWNSFP